MVDLRAQIAALRPEIDAAIAEVLDGAQFIKGPAVAAFEQELSAYLDGAHIVSCGNGTDALQLAFMALGVGPGDEVITAAHTFIATAEAAALLGAKPVFVDIDPVTYNLDPAQVEAALTPRTKALVPVHLYGQPADLDPLRDLADRHGLALVEDTAQALGATYNGAKASTVGTIGTLSFFPSKNLGAFGDGGAVVTRDADLADRVRVLANHGGKHKYANEVVGINSRLDTLQAAILRVHLRHLDAFTAARQRAARRYDAAFARSAYVTPPPVGPGRTHVYHQYTIRVPADTRDALAAALRQAGIATMIYYPRPLHRLPVFAHLGYGALPETERASREVLSLPMHPMLPDADVDRVVDAVLGFYGERTVVPDAVSETLRA